MQKYFVPEIILYKMTNLWLSIIVILLIFLGEGLSIYAELIAAKNNSLSSSPPYLLFLKMFLVITLAGGILIAGYMLGFLTFKNIWVVSVTSLVAILILEPFLSYYIFQQWPTKGAFIGLILGILGFIATLFIK